MLEFLDFRSLLLSAALVAGAFALIMFGTMRTRKTYPGYGRWAWAEVALAVLNLIQAFRGRTSIMLTLLVGNIAAACAMVLLAEGFRQFWGRPWKNRWVYAVSAVFVCGTLYYLLVKDSLGARTLLFCLYVAGMSVYAALPMLQRAPKGRQFGNWFAATVLLFGGLIVFYNLFAAPAVIGMTTIFWRTPSNAAFFLTAVMYVIGISFSFFLLTNERQVAELDDATSSLVKEVGQHQRAEEALRIEMLERHALEAQLKELVKTGGDIVGFIKSNHEFLDLIMDLVPIPLFVKDRDGRYIDCNKAFNEMFSIGREEIIGKTAHEMWNKNESDVFVTQDGGELFDHGRVQVYETTVSSSEGVLRIVQFHKQVLTDSSGAAAGFIGAIFDITERKHAEQRLAKARGMETVAQLAGGVAHFFNNQMCVVQMRCEKLLNSPSITPSLNDDVLTIDRAGKKASEITRLLLRFARLSLPAESNCDVSRILESARPRLQDQLKSAVILETGAEAKLPRVVVDPLQLTDVLVAMAQNADEAMPKGGKFTIRATEFKVSVGAPNELNLESGDYVCISVADTGLGMDETIQRRIFEPFFTTRGLAVAKGLSLASAWGFLNGSGGGISVASRLGQGTTFYLYLPTAKKAKGTTRTQPLTDDKS
jgi:PAS domain S-box-containing protein